MGKHTFSKDVRDRAKADGNSMMAFSFSGKVYRWDLESPVDNAVGQEIAYLMIRLFSAHLTDPSKVPTFSKESPNDDA